MADLPIEVRIDKYLWAIRVFKTRSDAAEACRTGKVAVGGQNAKSSKAIKAGDIITVRKGAVKFQYLVISPIEKRQGAQLVPNYATNITPQSELDKLTAPNEVIFLKRDRGAGRPTKRERREIDNLLLENFDGFGEYDMDDSYEEIDE
ncbi:MAG: RNA-binding S4 domain-containing protein [Bacteroidales bacterium]|nr:RNA-binding S4 domain-containing protein [Bacteroidales bacterium]